MNAPTQITAVPWLDRVTMARANEALGPLHIRTLRDEALAAAAKRHYDAAECKAIADACQSYLDCFTYPDHSDALDYLDEIDALLIDDDPGSFYVEDLYWRDSDYAIDRGMGH